LSLGAAAPLAATACRGTTVNAAAAAAVAKNRRRDILARVPSASRAIVPPYHHLVSRFDAK
jgi:hypothetical protein